MSRKSTVWFVEEERILALRKKIGCLLWQIPSSGMVAIDSFLSQHQDVTLHGFNFFSGKSIHYFQESPTQLITSWLERFVTHNPPCEKRWVESLLQEGRCAFLADRVAAALESAGGKEEEMEDEGEVAETDMSPTGKSKMDEDANRRRPGLVRTLLRDGMPSQFSI
jgi:hypothetical protein